MGNSFGTTPAVGSAAGRYTNSTLVNQARGTFNVLVDSDLDSTGTLNTTNLQAAIDKAEDELDDIMRGGNYQIPFVGTIPPAVERWATEMAVYHLHRPRGEQADDRPGTNLISMYNQARKEARFAARSNLIQLDATRNDRTPTHPVVIPV